MNPRRRAAHVSFRGVFFEPYGGFAHQHLVLRREVGKLAANGCKFGSQPPVHLIPRAVSKHPHLLEE